MRRAINETNMILMILLMAHLCNVVFIDTEKYTRVGVPFEAVNQGQRFWNRSSSALFLVCLDS